jgi:formate--tetrahydrofolate ligase
VNETDVAAVERGLANLEKHVENIRKFEQRCVVAINHFPSDTDEEIAAVREHCDVLGLEAVVAKPYTDGGDGCRDLAEVVRQVVSRSRAHFKPLYDWEQPIDKKIQSVASEMYGAEAVDYLPRAKQERAQLEKLGFGGLPVCIAKTEQSLSDNPALLGRPKDFLVTVREIQLAAGAGFVIPITGEILRMPGLPTQPLALRFDLTPEGEIAFS